MDWVMVVGGLVLLLVAGDALVRGAVNLALRLGVSALIVSLTVVAFGTSAPELLVSVTSVLGGKPGLALGNVVGSNIANILLILGLPALITTIHTSQIDTRGSFVQMLVATALVVALGLTGNLGPIEGLILLAAFAVILVLTARSGMKARIPTEALEGADPSLAGWKIAAYLVAGLIGLPVGAHFLVEGATDIARAFGVTETVIGLTLVALGTSLPELATSVAAAWRRQADVIMGNVIGSNFFNLLAILGVSTLFGHIPVEPRFMAMDFPVLVAASLLLVPFVFMKRDITRSVGAVLVALYIAFTVAVVLT